jgi:hypothetical protein
MWDILNLSIPDVPISNWDHKNVPYKVYQRMQKNKDNYKLHPVFFDGGKTPNEKW